MNVRADLIKLLIFTTIGVLIAALLYVTLGQTQIGPSRSYVVMMRDVSGLESGDLVRVAGVRVGQVDSVQVEGNDDNEVRVGFHVDSKQPVTTATDVLVRFENLLGDRYLELQQEPGQGSALKAGAVIPVSRTTPALDLDTLLNGFRPLFRGLEPQQINEFATNLISTLQGQGGTVNRPGFRSA